MYRVFIVVAGLVALFGKTFHAPDLAVVIASGFCIGHAMGTAFCDLFFGNDWKR